MVNIKNNNDVNKYPSPKKEQKTTDRPRNKYSKRLSRGRFSEYNTSGHMRQPPGYDTKAGHVYWEPEGYKYQYSPMYTPIYVSPMSSPLFSPMVHSSPYYQPQQLITPVTDISDSSLQDLLNNNAIHALVYDQTGSRSLQTLLNKASVNDVQKVFDVIKIDLLKISTNIFANYIVQKLLSLDPNLANETLTVLSGHFQFLAKDTCGCRVIQCLITPTMMDDLGPSSPKNDEKQFTQKNTKRALGNKNKVVDVKLPDSVGNFQKFNDLNIFIFDGQATQNNALTSDEVVEAASRVTTIYDELRDSLLVVATNINGNHVIQRLVSTEHSLIIADILERMENSFNLIIKDLYGCRVLQKLIDKGAVVIQNLFELLHKKGNIELNEEKILVVIKSINKSSDVLFSLIAKDIKGYILNQHSNYVIQAAIKHISIVMPLMSKYLPNEPQKNSNILLVGLTHVIKNSFVVFASHKYASNVVEACLCYLPMSHRKKLTSMFESNKVLDVLVRDPYGNYVIQTGITNCESENKKKAICKKLRENIGNRVSNHHEKHILEFIEKLN